MARPTPLAILALLAASCSSGPSDAELAPRIFNGTDVTERNGSVVIRLKKTAKELEASPGKEYWYCTGALVAEDCVLTASHCVRGDAERLKKDGDVWHPDAANNWPSGGNNAGRPKPKDGETVAGISKVADRGNNNQQDLAVLKLSKALPGTTLAVGDKHPKVADKFKALVLGNGSTETDDYGHRSLELTVFKEEADPKVEGWSYLYMFDPGTWKEADDKKRKKIAPGDSGGPVLYDGKIIGVSSRGFVAEAPEDKRASMAASVVAPEAQKWVLAQIKDVCGSGGGETSGGDESSTGDASTSGDDGGSTSGDSDEGGSVGTTWSWPSPDVGGGSIGSGWTSDASEDDGGSDSGGDDDVPDGECTIEPVVHADAIDVDVVLEGGATDDGGVDDGDSCWPEPMPGD